MYVEESEERVNLRIVNTSVNDMNRRFFRILMMEDFLKKVL